MLGLPYEEISPVRYSEPIGVLCGMEGSFPADEGEKDVFHDEMMVMQGLNSNQFNKLLDTMKRNRCSILLKAVVTDTNAGWSSVCLHKELSAEYEALRSAAVKRAASVHRKK